MRFSESWLREWVNPAVDTDTLSHQLSMAGLEVDSVERAAPEFSGVVVGEVLSREQHPDADKLSVTTVNVGGEEPLQIVCGAKNVAAGMRVPVATVGAVLPGGFKIKKARLRGVQSMGMICSASELGLADSSDGIMPLPADAPVGEEFRGWLALDDSCIEVDLTPDRGDCLSMIGIARDVSAINNCDLTHPDMAAAKVTIDDVYEVVLEAPQACPQYLCRVVKGINPKAETPLWMQERLRRGGIRSLSPVVDVTNYVLLELGQPMHGFDLDRLQGAIRVRMAQQDEPLMLLNDEEIKLDADTLVIADDSGPLAIAGIMGGAASGVTGSTTDILLESAFFEPLAIAGKARAYGQHTDSSHRFERGVDPDLQRKAMERATVLLQGIAGGDAGPVVEVRAEGFTAARGTVQLRRSRIERLLGIAIDDATCGDILMRLGMSYETNDDGWLVEAPSWRFDIAIEADLVEEIARIFGYENIPSTQGKLGEALKLEREAIYRLDRARALLASRDYQEVITYSFISPDHAALLDPEGARIRLSNPISSDMSDMRPTLWAGLIGVAKHNRARQQERIRLFETGLRFIRQDNEIKQEKCLSGLLSGSRLSEQWGASSEAVDFFDLKNDVEELLALTGCAEEFSFVPAEHPALHPGQSARIERNGVTAGWIGLLHPGLEKAFDIQGKFYLFELSLAVMEEGGVPEFAALSKFPSIRRDFALVVDAGTAWADIRAVIGETAPEIVRDVLLFDVYTGENIESGRKSLALGLILQDYFATLTDEVVQSATQEVLDALESRLGAKLRD